MMMNTNVAKGSKKDTQIIKNKQNNNIIYATKVHSKTRNQEKTQMMVGKPIHEELRAIQMNG